MADDWDASDRKLHRASVAAIKRFAREHRGTAVCCFFFDCDEPHYGHVSISFDTPANNARTAMELERLAVESRRAALHGKGAWQSAEHQLARPALSPFNTDSGDFEFPEYADVEFPAWVKLAGAGRGPKRAKPETGYLESNARLVIWRVAERLVTEEAFSPLTLAAPFLVGYGFHDQEPVVLRILNWGETT